MQKPGAREQNIRLLKSVIDASRRRAPRLIDEWQLAPERLWDAVRFECDHESSVVILTGSTVPPKGELYRYRACIRADRCASQVLWNQGIPLAL